MAFCTLHKDDIMLDSTPIENLFIQEFLPSAPGDYIKVYLYGLMQAHYPECAEISTERFAKSLGMEEPAVLDALNYWQRNGLLRMKDGVCHFLNVKNSILYAGAALNETYMYRYAEMNAAIGEILGSRQLKQSEWRSVYDWVEVLHISEEAVVLLFKYCVSRQGKRAAFQFIAATARDWAQKGILTPEQAEEYVSTFHLTVTDANRVAAHLGFGRRVSQEEHDLYEKWTAKWGFNLEAILAACARTTLSSHPNFAYLDKILATNRRKNLLTADAIRQSYVQEDSLKEKLLECAGALGARLSPAAESYYRQWLETYGLTHDSVLFICKEAGNSGMNSFKEADALMGSYVRAGKLTKKDIKEEQTTRRILESNLAHIKQDLGLKTLSSADTRQLSAWLKKMPVELISQGAEYSSSASTPVAYLNKILSEWEKKGIKTAGQARQEREHHKQNAAVASGSTSELDDLFETLGDTNESE